MEIKSKDDLITFLTDIQEQVTNMQETVDKLAPVEEESTEEDKEKGTEEESTEEKEDVDEIDSMLHEE